MTRPPTPPGFAEDEWGFALDAFEYCAVSRFYLATTPAEVLNGFINPEHIARGVWVAGDCVQDDEPSIAYLAELTDGRYVYADAWCDYTGWGCRDAADYYVGTREQVMSHMLPHQRAAVTP